MFQWVSQFCFSCLLLFSFSLFSPFSSFPLIPFFCLFPPSPSYSFLLLPKFSPSSSFFLPLFLAPPPLFLLPPLPLFFPLIFTFLFFFFPAFFVFFPLFSIPVFFYFIFASLAFFTLFFLCFTIDMSMKSHWNYPLATRFVRAFKYKPNDKQIQEELENLDNAIEKYKADERLMAQRMIVPKEEQRPLPGNDFLFGFHHSCYWGWRGGLDWWFHLEWTS